MPTFQFEAMDSTGAEIKDVIEAATEEDAQATIRQMGYFVTKITVKKSRKKADAAAGGKKKRGFVFGGVKTKDLTTFTRQLSILQDAGLPILRSLRILSGQASPGRLKYSLEDTCDEIEAGGTLSEAHGQEPQVLQPPLRQHDQGRRSGRCTRAHPAAARRLPRAGRIAQAKSQRRDDLPGRRHHRGRRHLDVHHDQDRALVRKNLRGLRSRTPENDRSCSSACRTGACTIGI